MREIKKTVNVWVKPTAEELAQIWCAMDANEQALFFNAIKLLSDDWDKPLCFQLQSIAVSKHLSEIGRYVMRQIGDYGQSQIA